MQNLQDQVNEIKTEAVDPAVLDLYRSATAPNRVAKHTDFHGGDEEEIYDFKKLAVYSYNDNGVYRSAVCLDKNLEEVLFVDETGRMISTDHSGMSLYGDDIQIIPDDQDAPKFDFVELGERYTRKSIMHLGRFTPVRLRDKSLAVICLVDSDFREIHGVLADIDGIRYCWDSMGWYQTSIETFHSKDIIGFYIPKNRMFH